MLSISAVQCERILVLNLNLDRQRSDASVPPLPASWSSEDALMQLYEETKRDRPAQAPSGRPPPTPSAAAKTLLSPSASLTGKGTGALQSPPASPPPSARVMRSTGERQFLYIQVRSSRYCLNSPCQKVEGATPKKSKFTKWGGFHA